MSRKTEFILLSALAVLLLSIFSVITLDILRPIEQASVPTLMQLSTEAAHIIAAVPTDGPETLRVSTEVPSPSSAPMITSTLPSTSPDIPNEREDLAQTASQASATAFPTPTATSTTVPVETRTVPTALPFPTLPPAPAPTYTYVPEPLPQAAVPNQVVIAFKPQTSQQERAAYIASLGGEAKQRIDALNTVVVEVPEQTTAVVPPPSEIVAAAEPDYYVSAQVAVPPSDPYYDQQWALPVIGAPDAWLEMPVDAPQVVVAVIDSGICADHPDLTGRVLSGWDFVEDDATPQDVFGHGCGVAGIIAANVDDGIGMAGVAPNAMILPLRVLDASGIGTYSDVAAALVYAADHGAQVINLSLGGVNPSSVLEQAVEYAVGKGVTVVAAAGNSGNTSAVLYPAAYDPVISVGSVDQNLQVSSFSSGGTNVDLLAPGRDVLSLKPDGGYSTMTGTSFAAPQVAGVASSEIAYDRTLSQDNDIVSFLKGVEAIPPISTISTSTLAPTIVPLISSPTPASNVGRYTFAPMGIDVNIPEGWIVNEYQNVGFGFSFYTPNVSLEDPNSVVTGAYITLEISDPVSDPSAITPSSVLSNASFMTVGGWSAIRYEHLNPHNTAEVTVDINRDNRLYRFVLHYSGQDLTSRDYVSAFNSLLNSLIFIDQVGELPIKEIPPRIRNLAFAALEFPFETGNEWKIASGGGYNNSSLGGLHGGTHDGISYGYALDALDLIPADGNSDGKLALAPTNGSLDHIQNSASHCIDISIDHIDDNNDLWLEVCHLNFKSSLIQNSAVTKSEVLGTLASDGCGGACTLRHIHIAVSAGGKGNPWNSQATRLGVPYTLGSYGDLRLSGISFPSDGSVNQYHDRSGLYSSLVPLSCPRVTYDGVIFYEGLSCNRGDQDPLQFSNTGFLDMSASNFNDTASSIYV